jgi:hypothetical protein
MIDVEIAVVGAFFYFTGQYGLALVLILPAIIGGAGAVMRSIANPDWYFQKPDTLRTAVALLERLFARRAKLPARRCWRAVRPGSAIAGR